MDTNGEGCDVNMSLVMAIANQNGIVVSGDWRAMKYWLQPDGGDPIFVRSIDRFQKIYRTKSNHCIGFCGHTKLDNGKELGEILQKIIEVFDKDFSVTQEFYVLLKTLPQNAIKNDIAFMVAGYENNEPKIITYSIDKEPIQNHILNGCAFAGIGVPEYISKVSNVSHEEIEKMSLKDMIRFLKNTNNDIYEYMKAEGEEPVISRRCDLLVLQPSESQWILPLERQKWVVM